MERENLWKMYSEEQLEELEQLNESYKRYLDNGKTENSLLLDTYSIFIAFLGGCVDLQHSSKSKPRNIDCNSKFSGSKLFCASNHGEC